MLAPALHHIETRMDAAAAALFGAAAGYAIFLLLRGQSDLALAYGSGGGLAGFVVSLRMLQRVESHEKTFRVATFAPRVLEFSELEELLLSEADRIGPVRAEPTELVLGDSDRLHHLEALVLTEADRLRPAAAAQMEPLLLDDVLAEMAPDSRVVRLFDRKAMPTPGQMKSRIDGHLERGAGAAELPDASQALSEALAQLRRSLA